MITVSSCSNLLDALLNQIPGLKTFSNIEVIEEPEKDPDQAENAEGSEFAEGDEDDGEKKEYVKKDFVARPYISDGVTE